MKLWLLGAALWMLPASAFAQAPVSVAEAHEDHTVVYELGWEGDWSRADGLHHGATVAFEVTPIEHWLELEGGVSFIHHPDGTEIPFDLIVKKPWTISRSVEFMAGIGPELIHDTGANHTTFAGLSAVADFMIWPRPNLGWYVEPGYERAFRKGGAENGLAVAAGLLIGR